MNLRIDGKPTDVLKIEFTETNNGGRFYSTAMFAIVEFYGLTVATVSSQDNEFNKRLSSWMGKMLAAVVKAADYEKPLDAYAGVPSLSSVLRSDGNNL